MGGGSIEVIKTSHGHSQMNHNQKHYGPCKQEGTHREHAKSQMVTLPIRGATQIPAKSCLSCNLFKI